MVFKEETIKKETIYEGKIINLETHDIRLPDGKVGFREIIKHPGGVCILARDENNKILLVRQYRKPMEEYFLELPAGKIEKELTPYENAIKELEEETGYIASSLQKIGEFASTPGILDEVIHLYIAKDLSKGVKGGDDDEYLDLYRLSDEEMESMIRKNEIKDFKTITAYLLSRNYYD